MGLTKSDIYDIIPCGGGIAAAVKIAYGRRLVSLFRYLIGHLSEIKCGKGALDMEPFYSIILVVVLVVLSKMYGDNGSHGNGGNHDDHDDNEKN